MAAEYLAIAFISWCQSESPQEEEDRPAWWSGELRCGRFTLSADFIIRRI